MLKQIITHYQNRIVKQIHAEFDTAEDRLLTQADELLQSLSIPTESAISDKAQRLHRIGFVKSETVTQHEKIKQRQQQEQTKLVQTREFADLIRYYMQVYPFQKFLSEPELDRICAKYSLVYAPIANYIKDVPAKNIFDIEIAKPLDSGHVITKKISYRFYVDSDYRKKRFEKLIKAIGCSPVMSMDEINAISNNWINNESDKLFVRHMPENLFYVISKLHPNLCDNKIVFTELEIITTDKSGLFIAAPASHFDTTGLTKDGKFGFLRKTIIEVKDPIVFRYCKGGIQVITKWGLEASDELLTNAIEN